MGLQGNKTRAKSVLLEFIINIIIFIIITRNYCDNLFWEFRNVLKMYWNSNRGFCNVHSTSASIQIWRQPIKYCTGNRFVWVRQKNIQSQVFKHAYSLSSYSERKENKEKGMYMGKNIWSLFANLELRFVSKINQISYFKMKHTQQSWERKWNPLMSLSWAFAA